MYKHGGVELRSKDVVYHVFSGSTIRPNNNNDDNDKDNNNNDN